MAAGEGRDNKGPRRELPRLVEAEEHLIQATHLVSNLGKHPEDWDFLVFEIWPV